MIVSVISAIAFWVSFISHYGISIITFISFSAVLEVVGAIWLQVLANAVSRRVQAIDSRYAREPAFSQVFQGLLWTAVVASIVMGLCALAQVPEARRVARGTKGRQTEEEKGEDVPTTEQALLPQQEGQETAATPSPEADEGDPPPPYEKAKRQDDVVVARVTEL
jgi:hypothetical protein